VNNFIEECRREWKQLRVPDPVADEMAADLAADLEEAESEGDSPEEVLGSAASDPRSFAASWAAARGVIPPPSLTRRPSLIHAAIATLTITAAIGAGLVIFASPHKSALDLPTVLARAKAAEASAQAKAAEALAQAKGRVAIAAPARRAVLISASNATNSSGVEINRVGSILLIVGLAGMMLSMGFLFWSSRAAPTTGRPGAHTAD